MREREGKSASNACLGSHFPDQCPKMHSCVMQRSKRFWKEEFGSHSVATDLGVESHQLSLESTWFSGSPPFLPCPRLRRMVIRAITDGRMTIERRSSGQAGH
ncbi:hypothetical protein CEXT_442591 [Caerostris extrusa]|uniref:Uncharacterized protein n=1 Tax=Caerostris extrusa TaxID=172846 RepID=A0AAV4PD80_CAEEX|nr:hypothetical protein CEXT_442591 [Caerostris extrusa]